MTNQKGDVIGLKRLKETSRRYISEGQPGFGWVQKAIPVIRIARAKAKCNKLSRYNDVGAMKSPIPLGRKDFSTTC